MSGSPPPSTYLADLLTDPSKTEKVPPEAVPALLGEIECLRAKLWARMMIPSARGTGQASTEEDRLLIAQEAAKRLGASEDYLYRHADKLPFTVRIGPRQLRFSAQGIERYIRQRTGKTG